jgi:predicted RNA-binding Zn-ribbon protein involved in translation (DUF1610 family)
MRQGNPKADKGYWMYARQYHRGPTSALISCPQCGETLILDNLQIDMHGEVGPGQPECPKCKWTQRLFLEDWDAFYRFL